MLSADNESLLTSDGRMLIGKALHVPRTVEYGCSFVRRSRMRGLSIVVRLDIVRLIKKSVRLRLDCKMLEMKEEKIFGGGWDGYK